MFEVVRLLSITIIDLLFRMNNLQVCYTSAYNCNFENFNDAMKLNTESFTQCLHV